MGFQEQAVSVGSFCIGGSGVLAMSKGKEFPETHTGGWGSVVWFTDAVQLREFPPWIPNVLSPSVSP